MEGEGKRTSKEIAEEIRRNEREYEQCVAEGIAEILKEEKELFEIQKKMISDLKTKLRFDVIPEHVLEMTIKQFKGQIEPERIRSIWYGV